MRSVFQRAIALLLIGAIGCNVELDPLLPARDSGAVDGDGLTFVVRFAHLTDTHVVDEESPARFTKAHPFTSTAWRPHERYATQIVDGMVRTVNRIHASGRTIDFLLHTGDATDNAQTNELNWFIGVMDGQMIDPLSGGDDRLPQDRLPVDLDAHTPFQAQGLYRHGVHGPAPSVPWYIVFGNHDVRALGLFPIVEVADGARVAPLPLPFRPGLFFPVVLEPTGSWTYGLITPAHPGPPTLLEFPVMIPANPQRAYFTKEQFIDAMFETATEPTGHGFAAAEGAATWYSMSPAPGVRLIGLDTNEADPVLSGFSYPDASLSVEQVEWLRAELEAAQQRGEIVIVASHHPSAALQLGYGSAVSPTEFRALLNEYPSVVMHVCGHQHRNRVVDRGGYVEIETCSTLDLPQEGRLIEIWRDDRDGSILVAYEMFSHIDDDLPPLGEDPLRAMREQARALAAGDKNAALRQMRFDPTGADPAGWAADRDGVVILHRP